MSNLVSCMMHTVERGSRYWPFLVINLERRSRYVRSLGDCTFCTISICYAYYFFMLSKGTDDEILAFVDKNFSAKDKFTWFDKGHVNGKSTREVYSFLKQKLPAEDGTTDIRWNFAKFLVDHEGTPFKRYGPKINPEDMAKDIEELLAKRNNGGK